MLLWLHGSSYHKINNHKHPNKCWKNAFSHQVYECAFFLHLWFPWLWTSSGNLVHTRNSKRYHGIIFFFVQKDIDKDMDKNYENNIYDEAKEPEVYVFKVSSLRKRWVNRGQESSKNKKTGKSTHESVGEVYNVDIQGKICNYRQEKRLKKCCWKCLHIKPFQFDGIDKSCFIFW